MHPISRNAKKAQSSTDFMMTYGLAIAVIVIIIAALFVFGVFDMNNFLGTSATGFSEIRATAWKMDQHGNLTLKLSNQVGRPISITSILVSVGATTVSNDALVLVLPVGAEGAIVVPSLGAYGVGTGYTAKVSIKYINLNNGFSSGTAGTLSGKIISGPEPACALPIASPPAGTYVSAQNVVLATEPGSTTYYTLDGTVPTIGSAVYSGPISIPLDTNMALKAFSAKEGYADSPLFSGTYVVTHALLAPDAFPPAGQYNSSQNVTLSSESGSTTYYTTDNSTPTNGSLAYSGAINVPAGANTTIKAYSVKSGYADSPLFSGTYSVASAQPPAPDASVVLQMNFDADTPSTAVDSSIYGNNGGIVGAAHVSGISGQALNFTGVDYVSIPNRASLNLRQNITLEAWVNWNMDPRAYYQSNTATRGWAQIMGKNGDNEWQLQHSQNNTFFEFALSAFNGTNTVRKYIQSTTIVQPGTWYHVVGVYDGQYMKLYVNGQNEKQVSMSGNISVSSSIVSIGRRFGGGGIYNDRYFNGRIDNVAIHNRSLSAGEIN